LLQHAIAELYESIDQEDSAMATRNTVENFLTHIELSDPDMHNAAEVVYKALQQRVDLEVLASVLKDHYDVPQLKKMFHHLMRMRNWRNHKVMEFMAMVMQAWHVLNIRDVIGDIPFEEIQKTGPQWTTPHSSKWLAKEVRI